jgi:Cu2+-containing amine oxidase
MFKAADHEVETEGGIDGNIMSARSLELQSASAKNLVHEPTAYEIEVPHLAFPLSEASYPPFERAAFAGKPFWVTR